MYKSACRDLEFVSEFSLIVYPGYQENFFRIAPCLRRQWISRREKYQEKNILSFPESRISFFVFEIYYTKDRIIDAIPIEDPVHKLCKQFYGSCKVKVSSIATALEFYSGQFICACIL